MAQLPPTAAIIVAGGSARRMGFDKLFAPLCGVPVLAFSIEAFARRPEICQIVIVTRPDRIGQAQALLRQHAHGLPAAVVCGGQSRQQSVLAGLRAVDARAKLLCIHDGARPLVRGAVIAAAVAAAAAHGAAAAALPVTDTVKRFAVTPSGHFVCETLPREQLVGMQTPQVFDRAAYEAAAARAQGDFTDDCQLFERQGLPVALTPGEGCNLKLTTPEDFAVAKVLLQQEENNCEDWAWLRCAPLGAEPSADFGRRAD